MTNCSKQSPEVTACRTKLTSRRFLAHKFLWIISPSSNCSKVLLAQNFHWKWCIQGWKLQSLVVLDLLVWGIVKTELCRLTRTRLSVDPSDLRPVSEEEWKARVRQLQNIKCICACMRSIPVNLLQLFMERTCGDSPVRNSMMQYLTLTN